MTAFALKLIFAHLMGDFLFQPDSWVTQKRQKKYRSPLLYAHIGIHFLALLVLLGFQLQYWIGILVILITHLLIDLTKLYLEDHFKKAKLFIFDQVFHLLVIVGVIYSYYPFQVDTETLYTPAILALGVALILLGPFAAVLMRLLMSKWEMPEDKEADSLPQAGKYIGILERFLVFGFIVLQQWPAIGWLIAAKSILRFSDLSRAKDRKLTEYVLIGTLLSFALAIAAGLLYLYITSRP
ncbi:DUF3307 domain-containing protein [Salinimicrobium sp. HB62]|uniref:DUF3307 domain-containing protein n=1 Tax=Salinimicrobium sp. HB62 TaxID=3077781 RepID=UPI002D77288F|nr:DUF3307 domain-containing protein [Salinimicrobium sp. HB62]